MTGLTETLAAAPERALFEQRQQTTVREDIEAFRAEAEQFASGAAIAASGRGACRWCG
ncbi:MAG: hypothetical protein IT158_11570 [Bryobacterales bacterium]|nr:hypothetical protein [Bryobacterales bacterium]